MEKEMQVEKHFKIIQYLENIKNYLLILKMILSLQLTKNKYPRMNCLYTK